MCNLRAFLQFTIIILLIHSTPFRYSNVFFFWQSSLSGSLAALSICIKVSFLTAVADLSHFDNFFFFFYFCSFLTVRHRFKEIFHFLLKISNRMYTSFGNKLNKSSLQLHTDYVYDDRSSMILYISHMPKIAYIFSHYLSFKKFQYFSS